MTFPLPEIDDAVVRSVRVTYGLLMLAMLISTLPHARRFFMSERWGGYARSAKAVDLVQNPTVLPLVLLLWLISVVFLILGYLPVGASLLNLLLCWYFFIWMRWRGALRGMGAPGFMAYWLGAAVFLLSVTTGSAISLRPLVLFALQVDLACIFLSAAIYKVRSGYLRGDGMELGLSNPQWGSWWSRYRQVPPRHPVFRILDHLAWSTEMVAAVAMLVPVLRFEGGLLLIGSFAFIGTQLRLGWLVPMVMLSGVLFFAPDTIGARLIASVAAPSAVPAIAASDLPTGPLAAAILTYVALLPFAYGGLAVNLYWHRRLPGPWQNVLDRYADIFGVILWRVFSADIVDFFVRISSEGRDGEDRAELTDHRSRPFSRFSQVAEMIAITSVFTTLKYYPSDPALFRERLLRYARTVPCPSDRTLLFEYVRIRKGERNFDFIPAREFVVDPRAGTVMERSPQGSRGDDIIAVGSPIREAARPGTYAPPA